jgi:hypothetical protein
MFHVMVNAFTDSGITMYNPKGKRWKLQ